MKRFRKLAWLLPIVGTLVLALVWTALFHTELSRNYELSQVG